MTSKLKTRLGMAIAFMLISISGFTTPFKGGLIEKGDLSVKFTSKGVLESISYKGDYIMRQHPGGVSTSGSTKDKYKPWKPQYHGKNVKMTKDVTDKYVIVKVNYHYEYKKSGGSSNAIVITKIYADKVTQHVNVQTSVKDLWRRAGSSIWIDGDQFTLGNFRFNDETWQVIPEERRNRNLIWPKKARTVDLVNKSYWLTFEFDGAETHLFDDRKPKNNVLNFEFGVPQQSLTNERGLESFNAVFNWTISFKDNKQQTLPKAVSQSSKKKPVSYFDLNEKKRLVEKNDTRTRYSLKGTWDQRPVGKPNQFPDQVFSYPAPKGKWRKASVPTKKYPRDGWQGPEHSVWYRTTFTLPEDAKGKEIYIHFEEVSFDARVFLNGEFIGRHYGGYIPVKLKGTKFAKFGSPNKLEVFVGDATAALDPVKYPEGPPKSSSKYHYIVKAKPKSVMAPYYGAYRGIMQDVFVDAIPQVHTDDIAIRTSVRNWTIETETTIKNVSKKIQKITVKNTVLDRDKPVKTLPDKQLTIPAGGSRTVKQVSSWQDPKLWDVKQPNLYYMKTELEENGKVVDTIKTRFGFREFWIEKDRFILNNKPIVMREIPTHIVFHPGTPDWGNPWNKKYENDAYGGAKAELETIQWMNANSTRMVHRPHPAFYYNITDEMGHLVIAHIPLGFRKQELDMKHPQLYQNTERIIAGLVKKERNHPSIVIWDGENEGMPYGEEEDAQDYANYYEKAVMDVAKELDPTRPMKFDGDGDLFGRAPIVDMHGADDKHNTKTCLPNANWKLFEGSPTRPYGYTGGPNWRFAKDKPLYFGEGLYWIFDGTKSEATRFIGELAYDDPKCGDQWYNGQERFKSLAPSIYRKIGLPIWRMLDGPAGYCPWSNAGGFGSSIITRDLELTLVTRDMMKAQRFFIKQLYRNFFYESKVNYDICTINDSRQTHTYQLTWQVDSKEKNIASGNDEFTLKPAEKIWKKLEFKTPNVSHKSSAILTVKLTSNNQAIHEEKYTINIYPTIKINVPEQLSISLFDPAGKTATVLEKMKVKFDKVDSIEQAISNKPSVIIIGENALSEGTQVPLSLDSYVNQGGKVLVLSQTQAKSYAPAVRTDPEQARTRAFVFINDAKHSLAQNLVKEEFVMWNHPEWDAAHAVTVNCREKFTKGAVSAVLNCDSMWFSPLQEIAFGKGLYIECSLDLVRKFSHEPVVDKLWNNIFKRLATYHAPSYKSLYVLRDEEITKRLQGLGIISKNTNSIPKNGILVVTGSSKVIPSEQAVLKAFVENGGTLWLHSRKNNNAKLFENLTGATVTITPYSRDWRVREVRRTKAGRESDITGSINSAALYARKSVDNVWNIAGNKIKELATGGAIAEVKQGKGQIILDRIAWDSPKNLLQQQWADHYLNSLAANLEANIDLYHYQKRKIYKPDDFKTVDLRAVVNRHFRDETPADKKGGWTDQGSKNDLRGMKTGQQTYHQIVFDIIDPSKNNSKSCLVLHSKDHASTCPAKSELIPVNAKASALFFLHTAAWFNTKAHTGKPLIKYIINYADGSSETAEALGGIHIKDWWTPGNCDEALGVNLLLQSKTESDVGARRRGLQLQEWQNPHPDKTIKSIQIASGNSGAIPIVLGITCLR